ncbi:MAG: 3-oxoacyl-ACP reductase FabG [Planctomycetota bacterium]|nr:3-oxoacyl-ACP reductase FabG [Planctomycetota bacterium]
MFTIDLSGKTALVTGAGQGLGLATATMLHQAGANVVINYFSDPQGLNAAKASEAAAKLGPRALALDADVRKPAQVEAMIGKAIDRFGSLNIVVNNAGILRDRTLRKMSSDEWQAVIDTNLTGVFNVCKASVERMADGGRIVNLASIAASVGFFGQANYAAAKAGVAAMARVLSRELGRRNITVNAVAPGVVLTEMGKSIPEEVRAEMIKNIPLGRFGEADDIARVILFLSSDLGAYVTGQTIHVNGGWFA